MAQHKHNKPCAQHIHSDLWWPSKAHQPVTVTEPPSKERIPDAPQSGAQNKSPGG